MTASVPSVLDMRGSGECTFSDAHKFFNVAQGPVTYDEALDMVMNNIRQILLKKHHDYGADNFLEFGEIGILVRVSDKFRRLKNMVVHGQEIMVSDESIDDSWADIAGYALQALMLRKGYLGLPMRNPLEKIPK